MIGVDLGVLGPLRVAVNERAAPIASTRHRALLATLLLDAGRPVPVERLVDALWGGDLPDNPRRALQLHVVRLRGSLSTVGAGRLIATCAEGYRLDAPPDTVDVGRFRRWVAEADRAGARADSGRQREALRRALAQWRGEPLADVPSESLQREAAPRLREQRLQALEQRIDLDLRDGRHAEVVAELLTLTAQQPVRERLWAQLMAALHATGQRSDALAAYHALRRNLSRELGIDPSDELQDRYAEILHGPIHPVGLPPVPRQLPAHVGGFAGRADALARLDALASGPPATPVAAIVGPAGIGKTALAAQWARRAADSFPDGQLWTNLRGYHSGEAVSPTQALTRFLRALGVPRWQTPSNLEDQADMYRSLVDGRRVLVVLDNAASAAQVRPLLPGGPGCFAVVTSRDQLTGLVADVGAQPLPLDLLTTAEARDLLGYRLGPAWVRADAAAVEEIVARCGRLPLALALVAARAATHAGHGPRAVADQLRTVGDLDPFHSPDAATDLRTVFSWSFHGLSGAAARLFGRLVAHPGPDITPAAAAGLADLPVARVRAPLAELAGVHLLVEHSPDRYALHDLLRAYARETPPILHLSGSISDISA
ncbi:BTAD domain-containing putative transcriptional regulator [Actinomycetes bacterium KLBMP 9797]